MQDEQSNMLSLQKINYLKNHEKKAYTYTNIINKEVLSKIKYILIICFIIIFRTHVELIEINNEIIIGPIKFMIRKIEILNTSGGEWDLQNGIMLENLVLCIMDIINQEFQEIALNT